MEYHQELEIFYGRYQVELIKAPEGFFYLRPRPSADIGTTVLSELDMLVGKVLCYLYLSPDRLASEGVFAMGELQEEVLSLADEKQLLRMVNSRPAAPIWTRRSSWRRSAPPCAVCAGLA